MKNTKAFTLIELLVVVLIIGILAAVALPQYTLAVDKARLSNLMTIMHSLKNAQERYYLANNAYATNWDELDVDKPTATEYTLNISSDPQGITGNYNALQHIILTVVFINSSTGEPARRGRWICYAKKTDARADKLCRAIAKRTTQSTWIAGTGMGDAYAYVFTW